MSMTNPPTQGDANVTLQRLKTAAGFVFDMDGTLVLGNKDNKNLQALPGAIELIHLLSERDIPYVVFTNGTPRTPEKYAEKLRQAGFPLNDKQMMTPATSAVALFQRRKYKRVCVLGGDGINLPLREIGIETVPAEGKPEVDAVFAGWFREFSMDNLEAACYAVSAGAKYYSASESIFFATANGPGYGTSRAISAVIRDLTGARVNVVGKPSMHALRCAGHRMNIPVENIVVVGDDPGLETAMAIRGKALAVAVDTGLGGAEDYTVLAEKDRPHLFLDSVHDLLNLYR